MRQLDLFHDGSEESDSIQERFERFHAQNPHIYVKLVRMARLLRSKGHRHLAIGMLWEITRFDRAATMEADGDWSLNDHYRSRYARLIMDTEPDLEAAFEIRELRAD